MSRSAHRQKLAAPPPRGQPRLRATTEFCAWMLARGHSELSIRHYGRVVDRWLRSRMGAREWLLQQEARSAQQHGGRPTATPLVYRGVLALYFRRHGLNPAELHDLPRPLRRHRTYRLALSREQEDRLWPLLSLPSAIPEPIRTCLYLIACTGMRQSEARTLRLEDLHVGKEDRRVAVFVRGLKDTPDRTVPLTADARGDLAIYLRGWRRGRPGVFLFPGKDRSGRKPLSPSVLTVHTRAMGRELGVPGFSPHVLRHTIATRMLEAGQPERVIQALLGHTAGSMTRRYMHPDEQAVEQALEATIHTRNHPR